MLDIVIATRNRRKFRELKALFGLHGIRWHSLAEFPAVPLVDEHGRTFDANAIRKARAVAQATGHLALADDSGLEVEALGWTPGVRSARFAGRHGDDHANNEKLLRMLSGLPQGQRRARYRCSLVLADPFRVLAISHGTWSGRIATRPQGHRGFGYDPIFLVPRFGKTVGQLPAAIKQRLSHRAGAARRMRLALRRVTRHHRTTERPQNHTRGLKPFCVSVRVLRLCGGVE
jgi:XTP/dITP diphosphohydrolase